MKYKVLKDYVSSKGKYQKVGGEVELAEDAVFAQGLLENGFIEGITDGGFEYGDKYCYVDGCGNIFWSIFCEDKKETPSKPKRGRPTEIKRDITKTSQSGLREGLTRATFIIREDTLDKLKERAYTDRKKLKDLVTEALDYYLDNHKETK